MMMPLLLRGLLLNLNFELLGLEAFLDHTLQFSLTEHFGATWRSILVCWIEAEEFFRRLMVSCLNWLASTFGPGS